MTSSQVSEERRMPMLTTVTNPSPELLTNLIRTFPLKPEYGSLLFYADGIYRPADITEEDYFALCDTKGVMPNTQAKFSYDYQSNSFITNDDDVPLVRRGRSKKVYK